MLEMPSSLKETHCEVLWMNNGPDGEQPVVIGWVGPLAWDQIESIEKEFADSPESWSEYFEHGEGTYLFSVHRVHDQVEDCGGVQRVTSPGYWHLNYVRHEPFPIDESGEHGPGCVME